MMDKSTPSAVNPVSDMRANKRLPQDNSVGAVADTFSRIRLVKPIVGINNRQP